VLKSNKRRLGGQQEGGRKRRKICQLPELSDSKSVILCTTQRFKERQCGRHLKLVFTEAIEEMIAAKKAKAEGPKSEIAESKVTDIASAISSDISEMNNPSSKLCEWIEGPGGSVVIELLTKAVSASALLAFIFDKAHPNQPKLSPFLFRLFPLDCTSKSREDEMLAMGEKMISATEWTDVEDDAPYAINYKNRGNKKLDRKTIVHGIAAFMPNRFKVNLREPKTVLLLQTFGASAGLSILKHGVFDKHRQYSLANFD